MKVSSPIVLTLSLHDGQRHLDDAFWQMGPEGNGRRAAELIVEIDEVVVAHVVEIGEEIEAGVDRLPPSAEPAESVLGFPVRHHAHFVALVPRRADILGQPRPLGFCNRLKDIEFFFT